MRNPTLYQPTEAEEQIMVVQYLEMRGHKFTAIPNETGGSMEAKRRAIRLKRQGVRKGLCDLLAIVNGTLIGIEMKRQHGGVLTKEQQEWLDALNAAGVRAKKCDGAKAAIEFIKEFEK